jgi:hypothetical protein
MFFGFEPIEPTEWFHFALVRVKDKTGCETRQIEMRLEVICLICLAV